MQPAAYILLPAWLVALAWFARRDAREYAAFKALSQTSERQRRYRRWLATAFLLFGLGGLLSLALVGRLAALTEEPAAFVPLSKAIAGRLPAAGLAPDLLGGVVGGMVIGVTLSVVLLQRTGRAPLQLGDIEPLMPRNLQEGLLATLLSLNAGVTEELFFRLVLPLLIVIVTGNAVVAVLGACAAFGLVHLYQGWKGMAATGAVGLAFAGVYLWAGSLLVPMALHVLLDILALAVRPALAHVMRRA